jgi:hypothetical protein
LYFTRPNQFEQRIPAHAQVSAELRDRAEDFQEDRHETNFLQGYVDSERQWHFDSLRDLPSPERSNVEETPREYAQHLVDRLEESRAIDR